MALAATASAMSSNASSGSPTTSAVESLFSGINEKISAHNLAESGDRMTVVPETLVPMGSTLRSLFIFYALVEA